MKTLLDLITIEMKAAFRAAGYGEELAKVTLSNRPDLCEYQCNGAMAAAKKYHKKPIDIANQVVEKAASSPVFQEITAVMPGFINIRLNGEWLAGYLNGMAAQEKLGLEEPEKPETIIVDYGGANVAKPLHVGGHHRREREADGQIPGPPCDRRRAPGGLGTADGTDYRGAAGPPAGSPLL